MISVHGRFLIWLVPLSASTIVSWGKVRAGVSYLRSRRSAPIQSLPYCLANQSWKSDLPFLGVELRCLYLPNAVGVGIFGGAVVISALMHVCGWTVFTTAVFGYEIAMTEIVIMLLC